MRCKQGDIAYVNNPDIEDFGRVVICKKFYIEESDGEPAWETDPPPLDDEEPNQYVGYYDSSLTPIRPSEEQDEMLRITGLPNEMLTINATMEKR